MPARTMTSPMAISITAPATDATTPSQLEYPQATMPLGPSITAPGEQLLRLNADPAGDRRYARARLQRLCHDLRLELVRPTSAKLPRRPLKAVGDRFDYMEGHRHRSSHRLTNSAAHSRSLTPTARRSPCRLPLSQCATTGSPDIFSPSIRPRLHLAQRSSKAARPRGDWHRLPASSSYYPSQIEQCDVGKPTKVIQDPWRPSVFLSSSRTHIRFRCWHADC